MTKKYISGRNKVISFSGLSTDRHLYLSVDQSEPNLGYPGEKNTIGISGTYYKLVTLDGGSLYDRYWIPEAPQTYLNGLTIFDEDIAIIAGIPDVYIGETICDDINTEALPSIDIDELDKFHNYLIDNRDDINIKEHKCSQYYKIESHYRNGNGSSAAIDYVSTFDMYCQINSLYKDGNYYY